LHATYIRTGTQTGAEHAIGLRWKGLAERLRAAGADEGTVEALAAAVGGRPEAPARRGRCSSPPTAGYPLTKVASGGWSQRRIQQRAENVRARAAVAEHLPTSTAGLWGGPEPTHLGTSSAQLRQLGVAPPYEERADALIVRALGGQGLVRGSKSTHAEEWKDPEPSAEGDPDVDRAPGKTRVGGRPPGMSAADVAGRSELASQLAGALDRVALPAGRPFVSIADLWRALGGLSERRRF